MKVVLFTLVCCLSAVALLFLGLGVKMLFKRHGSFKRSCSNVDPYTGESAGCSCVRKEYESCEGKPRYSPLEVNDTMLEGL